MRRESRYCVLIVSIDGWVSVGQPFGVGYGQGISRPQSLLGLLYGAGPNHRWMLGSRRDARRARMHNGRILPQEIAVVWLMPIDAMDYVRQSPTYGLTRQGPPTWYWLPDSGYHLIGYTNLRPDADWSSFDEENGEPYFRRRVFWLKDADRFFSPDGPYRDKRTAPSDSVDPRLVKPGLWTPDWHRTSRPV